MTNREIIEMRRAQSRAMANHLSELNRMEAVMRVQSRDAIARSRRLLAATRRLVPADSRTSPPRVA